MFQIRKGKSKSLDDIKDEHYNFIVRPKNIDPSGKITSFHNGSICKRIERKIKAISGKKEKKFFEDLLKNDLELLETILIGAPKKIQN